MAGSSVSSLLIACLDGESHMCSVELHLSLLCQVGLAVCCSLFTGRSTSAGMGKFNVKVREVSC